MSDLKTTRELVSRKRNDRARQQSAKEPSCEKVEAMIGSMYLACEWIVRSSQQGVLCRLYWHLLFDDRYGSLPLALRALALLHP